MPKRTERRTLIAAVLTAAAVLWPALGKTVAREDVLFLSESGESYTLFTTLRSDLPARELYVPGDPENNQRLFFYPPGPEVRELESGSILRFQGGSYALLGQRQFAEHEIKRLDDGSYEFRSWDGLTLGNGHFGKWNAPDPFEQFTYAWVLPPTITLIDYKSNRDGDWRKAGNTLVWTGQQVNDISFRIRFRVAPPRTITVMPEKPRGVSVTTGAAEKITLDTALLFSSGSSDISAQGEGLLGELASRLAARKAAHIIVEGHTDNQPLKPYLREKYPSNWELSALRATHVVRFLAEHGVDASILEARAYGSQHPVADNGSEEGRARNRRIELLVRDNSQADPVSGRSQAASSETAAEQTAAADDTDGRPVDNAPADPEILAPRHPTSEDDNGEAEQDESSDDVEAVEQSNGQ